MPRRVGSLMPSSPQLARRMAVEVAESLPEGASVIEVGAGTGAITRALARAVPPDQLTIVEVDRGCCTYLRRQFPRARVLEGLIEERLPDVLAPGRPVALVSSIPLFSLTVPQRMRVVAAFEGLVQAATWARVVQFTYVPWLPGDRVRSLVGDRVRPVWRNVPPAWVWSSTHGAGEPVPAVTLS